MTAVIPFRKPAPPDIGIGVGHRYPIAEKLGVIQGIAIPGEPQVVGGWMPIDLRRRYPWIPDRFRHLAAWSKDHGDPAINGGVYFGFGNYDENPLLVTSYNDARAELVAACAAAGFSAANFPAANPIVRNTIAGVTDPGQYPTVYWSLEGDLLVGAHSLGFGLPHAAQCQFTARLGNNFEMVPVDPVANASALTRRGPTTPGYSTYGHTGGYTHIMQWGGAYVSVCLCTGVDPITAALAYSHDGINWVMDPQRLLSRWPNMWGNTTHEFVPHGAPIVIDGKLWMLGAYRLFPDDGGDSTAGVVAVAPWSDDLRRCTGPIRRLIAQGGVGEADELASEIAGATIVPTARGDAILSHVVEAASVGGAVTVRRPYASRIRPAAYGEVVPPVVVASAAYDNDPKYLIPSGPDAGKMLCAGENADKVVEQYRFDGLTSQPAGITVTNVTTGTAGALTLDPLTGSSNRGGALLAGAAANQDVYLEFGKTFSPNFVSAAHLTIENVRFSSLNGNRVQFGFVNAARNESYHAEFQNSTAVPNRVRLAMYGFNLVTFNYNDILFGDVPHYAPWYTGQTDRVRPFYDFTFTLKAVRSTEMVRRWVLELRENDQHLFKTTINAGFKTNDVRPFVRVTGSNGTNCSVRFDGLSFALAKRDVGSGE